MPIHTIFVVYLGQIFRCKIVFIQQNQGWFDQSGANKQAHKYFLIWSYSTSVKDDIMRIFTDPNQNCNKCEKPVILLENILNREKLSKCKSVCTELKMKLKQEYLLVVGQISIAHASVYALIDFISITFLCCCIFC